MTHKFFFIFLIVSSANIFAAENKKPILSDEDRSGGFFKIGLGLQITTPNGVTPDTAGFEAFYNARYQFENRLFAEISNYRMLNDGVRLGYNFYNTQNWNFDLTTIQVHIDRDIKAFDGEQVLNKKRKKTQMLGLRTTGSFDHTTVQFIMAPYSFNSEYDDGLLASVWVDHTFRIKNWLLYASAGIEFKSKEILNYYYGIPEELATEHYTAYEAGSGVDYSGEVGVIYPISPNWLFESYYKYTNPSDSVNDNPVIKNLNLQLGRDGNISELGILISYVF